MRKLYLLACLVLSNPLLAASALPDCAVVAPAALADAFEEWWLAGRLQEDGAGVCLDRMRDMPGISIANQIRQVRRLGASGQTDAALKLAFSISDLSGLSPADRTNIEVTLAELLFWRERLAEARKFLSPEPDEKASRYTRLRLLFARARLEILSRDEDACTAAAEAATSWVKENFSDDDNAVASALLSLGTCQRLAGDHGASLVAFQRASALEHALGARANPLITSQALVLLAQGYKISGDFARAQRGYDDALAYLRANPEPLPAQLGALLHGMANLDRASDDQERIRQSLPRYVEAAELLQAAYGSNSARVSQVLNNYGNALGQLGRYEEAVAAYARALAIAVALGENADPGTLMSPISNTAMVRLWQKRFVDAESGFRRGLEIAAGQPAGSESSTLFSRTGLAASLWGQKRYLEANAEAERAERERQFALDLAVANMSEDAAIGYQEVQSPALDMAISIAYASGDGGAIARAWTLAMAARGQVMAGIAARLTRVRASTDPSFRALFDKWQQLSVHLAEMRLGRVADPGAIIEAEDAVDQAASALAMAMPGVGREIEHADINPSDLVAMLRPLHANLAGFVSSRLRAPNEYQLAEVDARPRDVYAFVAGPDLAPRLLRLTDENVLSAAVAAWREAAGDPHSPPERLLRAGVHLRQLVFDPLGVPTDGLLLQVPYGALHQFNFAALPDGDGYLIDRGFVVHTLNHERDLLLAPMQAQAKLQVLAVSDPEFAISDLGGIGTEKDSCETGSWPALPGTRREIAALDRVLPDSARLTDMHGTAANKTNVLAALPGKDVIHLATHGLRRSRHCMQSESLVSRGASLAAAPNTPASKTDYLGVLLLSHENGGADPSYLSDADIAGLALDRARWVVLSACDTGLGDYRAYEGAFGLRRAFQLAGARSVIMSLWRIDDAATADWMSELYSARFEHAASTANAVAEAQRNTLLRRRKAGQSAHPYYWAAFISAGDWR